MQKHENTLLFMHGYGFTADIIVDLLTQYVKMPVSKNTKILIVEGEPIYTQTFTTELRPGWFNIDLNLNKP